jgi:2-desacetyl-2-hydroxyethyl bacteriochlorophyllide A dehydrogenase
VREARALWTVAPRRVEIRAEALPAPGPDQLLVRALHSGVSRGTERLVFEGRVPESERARMRAPLQAGGFPFPVKYGYCAVGVVVEAGGPAAGRIGQRVFCLHPHQDLFLAPAAMCLPLPEALPSARAVLGANMETALNILWDARPLVGERALVVGAGAVGLLAARLLARMPGAAVAVHDPDPRRRAPAEAAGAAFIAEASAIPDAFELVIHASGHPDGLATALSACAFEGRVLEASWFGTRPVSLPLGEAFHARRLTIRATQVGALAPALRGRRTHAERLALALRLLAEDAWCDGLLGAPPVPFDALPERMEALLCGGDAPPCPLIAYI